MCQGTNYHDTIIHCGYLSKVCYYIYSQILAVKLKKKFFKKVEVKYSLRFLKIIFIILPEIYSSLSYYSKDFLFFFFF